MSLCPAYVGQFFFRQIIFSRFRFQPIANSTIFVPKIPNDLSLTINKSNENEIQQSTFET